MDDRMRCAALVGPRRMELREMKKPQPGPVEVLIRVRAVGICGSDLHTFEGRLQEEASYPLVIGHEFAGEVVEVGPEVSGLETGTRAAVAPARPCGECEWCLKGESNVCPNVDFAASHGYPGCLCDYYVVRPSQVHRIPDSMSFGEATCCEPMAVALHLVENLVEPTGGESYAVIGAGPAGLTIVTAARLNGASTVFCSDLVSERVQAAAEMGADYACNASEQDFEEFVMRHTDGRGVDVAVEAAGDADAIQQVFRVSAIHGRGVVLGIPPEDVLPCDMTAARHKELQVTWARRSVGKDHRAMELIEEGVIDMERFITHRFPLEEAQTAFDYCFERRDGALKVVITL